MASVAGRWPLCGWRSPHVRTPARLRDLDRGPRRNLPRRASRHRPTASRPRNADDCRSSRPGDRRVAMAGASSVRRRVDAHRAVDLHLRPRAISHKEREVLFDREFFPAQDFQLLDARFDPSSFEPLVFGPGAVIPYPLDDERGGRGAAGGLGRRVLRIRSLHRGAGKGLARGAAITEPSVWIVHPGVDPTPWGYAADSRRWTTRCNATCRFFASNDQLAGGVIHTRLGLRARAGGRAVVSPLASARRRRRSAGSRLAALAYQASLLVGLMGTGYRLNIPCVVFALALRSYRRRCDAVQAWADNAARALTGRRRRAEAGLTASNPTAKQRRRG